RECRGLWARGGRRWPGSGGPLARLTIDLEPYARAPVGAAPAVRERVDQVQAAAPGVVGCRGRRRGLEARPGIADLDPQRARGQDDLEPDRVVDAAAAVADAVRDELARQEPRRVRDRGLEAAGRERLDRVAGDGGRVRAAGQPQAQRAL